MNSQILYITLSCFFIGSCLPTRILFCHLCLIRHFLSFSKPFFLFLSFDWASFFLISLLSSLSSLSFRLSLFCLSLSLYLSFSLASITFACVSETWSNLFDQVPDTQAKATECVLSFSLCLSRIAIVIAIIIVWLLFHHSSLCSLNSSLFCIAKLKNAKKLANQASRQAKRKLKLVQLQPQLPSIEEEFCSDETDVQVRLT
jgi:hypothetical protein